MSLESILNTFLTSESFSPSSSTFTLANVCTSLYDAIIDDLESELICANQRFIISRVFDLLDSPMVKNANSAAALLSLPRALIDISRTTSSSRFDSVKGLLTNQRFIRIMFSCLEKDELRSVASIKEVFKCLCCVTHEPDDRRGYAVEHLCYDNYFGLIKSSILNYCLKDIDDDEAAK